VDDVNVDPIVIVNGFTKNFRLPGWRVCWIVGPAHSIEVLSSIGSFMDGGPNNVLQEAACAYLEPDFVKKDALALQGHFREKVRGGGGRGAGGRRGGEESERTPPRASERTNEQRAKASASEQPLRLREHNSLPLPHPLPSLTRSPARFVHPLASLARSKRDYLLKELKALGIKVHKEPSGTFYIWADVSGLPAPLNNGVVFFEYCIRHKVIAVPGIFFDVNPLQRRKFHKSPWVDHLRMSYGPAWPNLKQAVAGMKDIIEMAKAVRSPRLPAHPPPSLTTAQQDKLPPLDSYEKTPSNE
jgi:hypothetical protein